MKQTLLRSEGTRRDLLTLVTICKVSELAPRGCSTNHWVHNQKKMDIIVTKLLDLIRTSTIYVLAVAVTTGLILSAPRDVLEKLYLTEAVSKYGYLFSILFVLSSVLILIKIANMFWNSIQKGRKKRKDKNTIASLIQGLDSQEKAVLREFFLYEQRNTRLLPIDHPVIKGLCAKGILEAIDVPQFDSRGNWVSQCVSTMMFRSN